MLITIAITVESIATGESPVILVSERRRSANRTFRLLKFRVFRVRAWRDHLATRPDVSVKAIEREADQLTRVGRLLKRCYLDELPQFVNILCGDMSLVGPVLTSSATGRANRGWILQRGDSCRPVWWAPIKR